VVHHARENAGIAAPQRDWIDPGPFEGLPRGLQQQALLGVHQVRFLGRDPEEVRVELGGVVEEAALTGVRLAGLAGLGIVDLRVPATVGRELGHHVTPVRDHLPQAVRCGHSAGKTAAHRHDGNGFGGRGLQRGVLLTQPFVVLHGLAQRLDDLLDGCAHVLLPLVIVFGFEHRADEVVDRHGPDGIHLVRPHVRPHARHS
jgi:hypothetical protein